MIYIILVILTVLVFSGFVTVSQSTVTVTEIFGKYRRTLSTGLQWRFPFIETIRERVTLRQQNFALTGNYPSLDKVIISIGTNLLYSVDPTIDGVKRYVYTLENREESIAALVENSLRTYIAKETHEGVLEKKEELAQHIRLDLSSQFKEWGMVIIGFQITNVTFPVLITNAMSEVVASEQLRKAAQNKGEAFKVQAIKEAEGERERKRLQGEGIALERQAIAEGIRTSVQTLSHATHQSPNEVLAILSLTQYLDTLKSIGMSDNTKILFVDSNIQKTTDLLSQLIAAQDNKL
jgi:regulator of protease activity HflC (stomatin/prohibitin superfamily)